MRLWNLRSEEPVAKKNLVTKIAYGTLSVIGALIFLALLYYSTFYTQYMMPGGPEMAVDIKDHPLRNLASFLLLTAAGFGLHKLGLVLSEKKRNLVEVIAVVGSMLWIGIWGWWWIHGLDRVPEGDQAFIYGGASYFIEGGYSFLGHGGYCQFYSQQLGQIAVVEFLFRIVGTYQYFVIEKICVFFAAFVDLLGYLILRETKAGFASRILYSILMMGCIPLVCYTSWVYGDLPSTFFLLLAVFFILRLHKNCRWYYMLLIVLSFVMASLVRKNSMIFLVAFGILAGLYLICLRRWRMVLVVLLAFLGSVLAYEGIYAMYEKRSGYEIESGLPASSWIAMGMQESWNGCGWYNNYPKEIGGQLDWDYAAVGRHMSWYIRDRAEEFLENPGYAIDFYKKKILSQWNEPLYQSVFFSTNFKEEAGPAPGSALDRLYHTEEGYFKALGWADCWQFLIYLGAVCYFLFAVRKPENPMELLLAVTVVGGFFFSILWEAKARYSFPYYLMMFPMAVTGYQEAAGVACRVFERFRRVQKTEETEGK